jgi:hypothetical protein
LCCIAVAVRSLMVSRSQWLTDARTLRTSLPAALRVSICSPTLCRVALYASALCALALSPTYLSAMGKKEVKHLERTPRTPANGWSVVELADGVRSASRDDNAPKRVGASIHEAWKQLRNYAEPKILVFLNDDGLVDVQDLGEAFNGFLEYGNEQIGYLNVASAKIAEGRILEEKGRIDIYIWIDRRSPLSEPTFRMTTSKGREMARRFFGCP